MAHPVQPHEDKIPISAIASTVFRIASWFYLRVIPVHRYARFVLPSFYLFYLVTLLSPVQRPPPLTADLKPIHSTEPVKTEEDEKKTNDNGQVPPSAPVAQKSSPIEYVTALVFATPSSSKALSILAVALNTLLLLFAADFAYSPLTKTYDPTFTRVGALDSSSAKILVRYPSLEEHQLRVVYRQVIPSGLIEGPWKDGPVIDIEEDKDFTGVGRLNRLWPSSKYEYRLAFLNSTLLPYPAQPIPFTTFPDSRLATGVHFRFLTSSCTLPNFPYSPLAADRIKGWDILADYIWPTTPYIVSVAQNASSAVSEAYGSASAAASSQFAHATDAYASVTAAAGSSLSSASVSISSEISSATSAASAAISSASQSIGSSLFANAKSSAPAQILPEFMLFLGDFIYADVPFWSGDRFEHYTKLYKRVYSSLSFRRVYERLPIFTIWDDHEFINDFAGAADESKVPYLNASKAFTLFNGNANPDPVDSDETYYEFRYGDNAFFVLDTRSYRTEVPPLKHVYDDEGGVKLELDVPPEPRTMLGEKQLTALHSWINRVNTTTTWKFIVTSVPFTTLWHGPDGQKDSWAAYREERDSILDVLEWVPNVVLLSGDRHEFAVIELREKILEISVSPLSQFALTSLTLRSHSEKMIQKNITVTQVDENGDEVTVESVALVPEEKRLHYIPAGNYKFGSFEVDTTDRNKPTIKIEAIINGKSVYELNVVGKKVSLSIANALGHQITSGIKGVLDKIGLNPLKWM